MHQKFVCQLFSTKKIDAKQKNELQFVWRSTTHFSLISYQKKLVLVDLIFQQWKSNSKIDLIVWMFAPFFFFLVNLLKKKIEREFHSCLLKVCTNGSTMVRPRSKSVWQSAFWNLKVFEGFESIKQKEILFKIT